MADKQTTLIYITNATDSHATIELAHRYSDREPEFQSWQAGPRETVGPIQVHYETGFLTGFDYWWVKLSIKDGPKKGVYRNNGSLTDDIWKECMLEKEDANSKLNFTVDTEMFHLNMNSSSCQDEMELYAPYSPISNVFVLMLENHSFDHLLGFSGITGKDARTHQPTTINGLSGTETNSYEGVSYQVKSPGIDPMPSDPGHEFLDTIEQLCGKGTSNPFPAGPYPPIHNDGFVANYATTTTEGPTPPGSDIGDIMRCSDSASEIPSLYTLAKEYVVCDNWFSSIPGPTWPNRFFAMAASSSGLDTSPSKKDMFIWETFDGVSFSNGSIFDKLKEKGLDYRIYNDKTNLFGNPLDGLLGGEIPIASALKGIQITDVDSIEQLAKDVRGEYPFPFTFIEPNYGDIINNSYKGGSSQHPMDSLQGGDELAATVYSIIRNSPLWETSLLIITYDEHGGFYDHAVPPAANPPGDTPTPGLNDYGFDFSNLGVRVPAILISPLMEKNVIDKTIYDHTSMLETVIELFDLDKLTNRSSNANTFQHLFLPTARQDCFGAFDIPERKQEQNKVVDLEKLDQEPLPERGNIYGFLFAALKAHLELSDGSEDARKEILENLKTIETSGQARQYFAKVVSKVREVKRLKKEEKELEKLEPSK